MFCCVFLAQVKFITIIEQSWSTNRSILFLGCHTTHEDIEEHLKVKDIHKKIKASMRIAKQKAKKRVKGKTLNNHN
jgi:hypothetical protein